MNWMRRNVSRRPRRVYAGGNCPGLRLEGLELDATASAGFCNAVEILGNTPDPGQPPLVIRGCRFRAA